MPVTMARPRITIDVEEAYKRAFSAWANLEGLTLQELFQQLVNEHCPADILKRAKASAPADDDEPKKPKR